MPGVEVSHSKSKFQANTWTPGDSDSDSTPLMRTYLTRCSAIAERPRCRVRYSFRQK